MAIIVLTSYFTFPVRITIQFVSRTTARNYSYYVCTQIFNESEHYLIDWLDHQFNVVGFKNVCLINTGQPLSASIRRRFPFAYVEKRNREQEFNYCLTSCFIDESMRAQDMLMIQDVDEYLNVRQADAISRHYDKYELFHFTEIRYGQFTFNLLPSPSPLFTHRGFVLDREVEWANRSIRHVNLWRKPHTGLGENDGEEMKQLFKCKVYGGWPSCNEGNGKEMIRVGAIRSLSTHFHTSQGQVQRRLFLNMAQIRLNHYMMRTREDASVSASKWSKSLSRIGQIASNAWFRIVFDDSILESKKLL